ncbi:MAG: adenosylcobinamide-GDP ribazoletransferase [Dehalococcoidia bacterium]|nr:adenosylcobinamide-GDP ribazoletransferase [Dehalococcoidia bacterium]
MRSLARVLGILGGALIAFEFLTPLHLRRVRSYEDRVFAEALGWYPLIGLIIGGVLVLADRALSWLLPPAPAAALLVALLALISGGLHLDGVADTADGMAIQGDRAARLGVMSEGNTGPAGVMALLLVLLAEWAALATLPPPVRTAGLLIAPALARWTVVPVGVLFRPARPRGLGHALAQGMWPVAAPLASAIAVGAALGLFGLPGLVLLATAAVAAVILAGAATRLLDGVTGDVFGAAIEVAQVAVWMALVAAAAHGWIASTLSALPM